MFQLNDDQKFMVLSYISGFDIGNADLLSNPEKLHILNMMLSGECGILHDQIVRRQSIMMKNMPEFKDMYPFVFLIDLQPLLPWDTSP